MCVFQQDSLDQEVLEARSGNRETRTKIEYHSGLYLVSKSSKYAISQCTHRFVKDPSSGMYPAARKKRQVHTISSREVAQIQNPRKEHRKKTPKVAQKYASFMQQSFSSRNADRRNRRCLALRTSYQGSRGSMPRSRFVLVQSYSLR
jgi:hypothetical protein